MEPISAPSAGAPLLQAIVTFGLALLLAHLHRRHGKEHFRWWAIALMARVLSVAAIVTFMLTGRYWLLYLHQVFLGWTAFGLLYAAQVFSQQLAWRGRYWLVVAFPVVWSAIAIFVLDSFVLAAGLAVVVLALATAWAGAVFLRYRRRTGSPAAGFLSGVMFLWALHHLDYPLLLTHGLTGIIGFQPEAMASYRQHPGGVWSSATPLHREWQHFLTMTALLRIPGLTDHQRGLARVQRDRCLDSFRDHAYELRKRGEHREALKLHGSLLQHRRNWKDTVFGLKALASAARSCLPC